MVVGGGGGAHPAGCKKSQGAIPACRLAPRCGGSALVFGGCGEALATDLLHQIAGIKVFGPGAICCVIGRIICNQKYI